MQVVANEIGVIPRGSSSTDQGYAQQQQQAVAYGQPPYDEPQAYGAEDFKQQPMGQAAGQYADHQPQQPPPYDTGYSPNQGQYMPSPDPGYAAAPAVAIPWDSADPKDQKWLDLFRDPQAFYDNRLTVSSSTLPFAQCCNL